MSKKKLLIFVGALSSGGAERVTVALSKYMSQEKNYAVVVVTLNEKVYDFYTLDDSVRRISMDMSGATSGLSKFYINLQRLWKFRQIVKNEKPDIVLGMITRHAVLAVLGCFGLDTKVIVSERSYPKYRPVHTMWDILRKLTYRFTDSIVVQTKPIADWIKTNTKSRNVQIIPNSVTWPIPKNEPVIDTNNFLTQSDKLILAVGSLKNAKGYDVLVTSVVKFLNQYPNWKMVILGDEKNDADSRGTREHLLEIIKSHDLNGQIFLPGKAGNVTDWYLRSDIYVLSSRYEGFPNVLLEAMASGTACVSFDCETGPKELIDHEVNGLLVEKNNTEALQAAIQRLMNNSEFRSTLGKKAISVREEYSEKNIFEKWSDLFEKTL